MAAYGIARFFHMIGVEERDGMIRVTGIPADIMSRDIAKAWKTSKIVNNIFSHLGPNHFFFASFFAIEVSYILNDLIQQSDRQTSRAVLKKILDLLMEKTWLHDLELTPEPLLDPKYLSRLAWRPKPHQVEFLQTFSTNVPQLHLNGYLLASAPGSGKTFMDLMMLVCLGDKAPVKIIISPKNALQLVWYATISDPSKTAFHDIPTAWYSSAPGPAPKDVEFVVCHYEALDRALVLGRQLSAAGTPFSVCVDESHNFNEMTAQRTLDLITLCRLPTARYHLWASGSPIKALGTEAIPLLRSIDPLFTEDVMVRYKKIFGGDAKRANEILQHRLNKVMFKVAKDVIISDKPITIQHKVTLKDSKRFTTEAVREEMRAFIEMRMRLYQKDMDLHKKLFQTCLSVYEKSLTSKAEILEFAKYKQYIAIISKGYDARSMGEMATFCRTLEKLKLMPRLPAELRREFKKSQSVVKYVSLKVQGEALGTILGKRRAECATELAKHCGLEDMIEEAAAKTLVFSSFVSTVLETVSYLTDKGFHPKPVSADTNAQLTEIVGEFDKDPAINPLCATYKSLSTAVPLIMANSVILLDLPVRQYQYDQTISRVHRLGQTRQVYIHEILLDTGQAGNVSTRAQDIISWSRDQVAALVGEEFSGNDIDVITEKFNDNSPAVMSAFSASHEHFSAWDNALSKLKAASRR